MIIQTFKCDFPECNKEFKPRSDDGQPTKIGGCRGVIEMPDGGINGIEWDFCPECWEKVVNFIVESNKPKIIKPNGK